MGNTPSNKFCPKSLAENGLSPSKEDKSLSVRTPLGSYLSVDSESIKEESEIIPELICNPETPYGCLGRRFIGTVRMPDPPSIIVDSLNLLGFVQVPAMNYNTMTLKTDPKIPRKMSYSSQNWTECRDFVVTGIIRNYEKADVEQEYEKEKIYLSNHLDTYGWVERTYPSSGLLRGELIAPNKFIITLYVDRPDIKQSFSTEFRPFNTSESGDDITEALTNGLTSVNHSFQLIDGDILNKIFISQESINNIITYGYISNIIIDPPTYYKISVDYVS